MVWKVVMIFWVLMMGCCANPPKKEIDSVRCDSLCIQLMNTIREMDSLENANLK